MSLINSVLGPLSPKFRKSFEDQHELPLYNSPPTSPAFPPRSITASAYQRTRNAHSSLPKQPRIPYDLLAVQRKARHLEQKLQELLDAQADGLIAGLGQDGPDDILTNGSTTPTISSIRTESVSSSQPPVRLTISLSAARRGIHKRILQLATVKAEEESILEGDLRDLEDMVNQTETWAQKRHRLEKRIKSIEGSDSGATNQALHQEATKLEQEIRQKEEELWAMKARHRHLVNQLADAQNSMEAKLSSYKTSLDILDREVTEFLARPPLERIPLETSTFFSLPPKRRTLDMARDYWHDEHSRLAEKCNDVDIDRAALEEGADLWKGVIRRVNEFEDNLQREMQPSKGKEVSHQPDILTQMEATTSHLEESLELATSRQWNLLVCAIGAELEAFKQARDILKGALSGSEVDLDKTQTLSKPQPIERGRRESPHNEKVASESAKAAATPARFFDTDDEDPDPELLISHQDTDTD